MERDHLKLAGFYHWFSPAVCRWLDIALFKALLRIGKAVGLDALIPVDPLVKHSSSAVDTVTVFYQVNYILDPQLKNLKYDRNDRLPSGCYFVN